MNRIKMVYLQVENLTKSLNTFAEARERLGKQFERSRNVELIDQMDALDLELLGLNQ